MRSEPDLRSGRLARTIVIRRTRGLAFARTSKYRPESPDGGGPRGLTRSRGVPVPKRHRGEQVARGGIRGDPSANRRWAPIRATAGVAIPSATARPLPPRRRPIARTSSVSAAVAQRRQDRRDRPAPAAAGPVRVQHRQQQAEHQGSLRPPSRVARGDASSCAPRRRASRRTPSGGPTGSAAPGTSGPTTSSRTATS